MGAGASAEHGAAPTDESGQLVPASERHTDVVIMGFDGQGSMVLSLSGGRSRPNFAGGEAGARPGNAMDLAILYSLFVADAQMAAALAGREAAVRSGQQNATLGAPPTSPSALRKLPVVRLSEGEWQQDGNDRCCVCLEPQRVGDFALKLPCGHCFHKDCAVPWLGQHCTCPNCRYELPTEDSAFKSGRKDRMRSRRPRYPLRDLMRTAKPDLRRMLSDAGHPSQDSEGVGDLVKRLIDTRTVELANEVHRPRALDVSADTLRQDWSDQQIRDLMREVGVDDSACQAKADLVDVLLASGRVRPLDDSPDLTQGGRPLALPASSSSLVAP